MGKPAEDALARRLRELEDELGESRRHLEETEATARIGSWEWTLQPARPAKWSKELLRIFGRDVDGAQPTRAEVLEAVHPEDRSGFEALIARVDSTPGPFGHSYRIVDPEGKVHYMEARGYVEADDGGTPVRTFGTTQDITELKEFQERLERAQRFEALGQLAGGVAHDFNNLLSVILNYAEYMVAVSEDPETLKGLREIERAAGSAADLTRQLLLFSRRQALECGPIDLSAVVEETKAMLRRTIDEKIDLRFTAPAGLPSVRLGSGQAQQVLVNLAVNARDALPDGGTIEVMVSAVDGGGIDSLPVGLRSAPHLLLTVSDDGHGMSKEVAGHAFDPFFTTKPRGQGTGLGLATVYGIVNQAGGLVEIESAPQRGTTVSVYLPVTEERAAEERRGAEGTGEAADREVEGVVLVVENEPAVQAIVCSMLERHGFRTRTADNAADAEEIVVAGEEAIDVLLTDVLMPGASGTELVRRLRARDPDLRAIYMSGYAGDPSSPLGGPWDAGTTVLEKPFTEAQLLRAVSEQLEAGT